MSVPTLAFSVFSLLSLNCPYDTVDLGMMPGFLLPYTG